MFVPPTTVPPAPALAPVGVVTTAASTALPVPAPVKTALEVRAARLNVLANRRASVTGVLLEDHRAGNAGEVVSLQALSRHGWRTLASSRTGAHGRFRLSYLAHRLGSRVVRLRFAGGPLAQASRRRLGRLNVYRLAEASWYGGGGGLACGGQLTSSTLGVANKTLPCGTLVTLHYGAHTVRVPVVDRGPYVAGREFDLTEATKRALGFGDLGQVWSTS
jgi:rare lipoprotein A